MRRNRSERTGGDEGEEIDEENSRQEMGEADVREYRRWPADVERERKKKNKKKTSQQTVDLQFLRELLAEIRRSRIKHYKMFSGAARSSGGAGRMLWWQNTGAERLFTRLRNHRMK